MMRTGLVGHCCAADGADTTENAAAMARDAKAFVLIRASFVVMI
jgi:hypothetical protein